MPFTPFHFGQALPIIFLDFKKKRVDVVSCLIGSVIVDIHAIIIFFFNLNQPFHGPVHSFFIATFLGVFTGISVHFTAKFWNRILKFSKWEQKTSLLNKILWALSMCYMHLILDGFIYPEMNVWWPFLNGNPFFGILSSSNVYLICTLGIIFGIVEYIIYLIWYTKNSQKYLEKKLK